MQNISRQKEKKKISQGKISQGMLASIQGIDKNK